MRLIAFVSVVCLTGAGSAGAAAAAPAASESAWGAAAAAASAAHSKEVVIGSGIPELPLNPVEQDVSMLGDGGYDI